jgi:hypothetical protein
MPKKKLTHISHAFFFVLRAPFLLLAACILALSLRATVAARKKKYLLFAFGDFCCSFFFCAHIGVSPSTAHDLSRRKKWGLLLYYSGCISPHFLRRYLRWL